MCASCGAGLRVRESGDLRGPGSEVRGVHGDVRCGFASASVRRTVRQVGCAYGAKLRGRRWALPSQPVGSVAHSQ
jgi:hypothetical protein